MTDPRSPTPGRIAELRRHIVNASYTVNEAHMLEWLAEFEDRVRAEAAARALASAARQVEALPVTFDFDGKQRTTMTPADFRKRVLRLLRDADSGEPPDDRVDVDD